MNIEKVKLDSIKPYWRNPRNNDMTIEPLKQSIIKFGFKVPIVIDCNNTIITGHSRFKALQLLKGNLNQTISELDNLPNKTNKVISRINELKEINEGIVSVIIAKDLTEKEAKEYRIADNKVQDYSSWNLEYLSLEARELNSIIGFTSDELNNIINEHKKVNYEDYTKEDIEETELYLTEKFEDNLKEDEIDKIRCMCPYCKKEFEVSKKELLTSKYLNKGLY